MGCIHIHHPPPNVLTSDRSLKEYLRVQRKRRK
uniref:Uncharacterized protein n=1 Tax=Rhizophora mucronata TaxID=61149 RepID=A0A2P2M2X6_RHIMU